MVSEKLAQIEWIKTSGCRFVLDGSGIRKRVDGAMVPYVHLLFDQHQIVTASGLNSESYPPVPRRWRLSMPTPAPNYWRPPDSGAWFSCP